MLCLFISVPTETVAATAAGLRELYFNIHHTCADKYYGLDHDAYGHVITEECLEKSQHQLSDKGVYESQGTYDPLNVHMGQMTDYK